MRLILLLAISAAALWCQTATVQVVGTTDIPTLVDGNSPTFWVGEELRFLTSTGAEPVMLRGYSQYELSKPTGIQVEPRDHYPIWIEAVWMEEDGTLLGWYHHEPGGLCGSSSTTAPQIGAAFSLDYGETWTDLGIVLSSGDPIDCSAGNELFGGGNGDFSVILDRNSEYFYFVFTNYGGDVSEQGVSIARMAFTDRWNPSGNVFKYHGGAWGEPGLGGTVSPIFPASVSWMRRDTDSFWGPSIHWNTYLERYVILMNRSCCSPRWPQEGIYVTFNADLANPGGWKRPERLLARGEINWRSGFYPQVIGDWPNGTDREADRIARLYIHGRSRWVIHFQK